MRSSDKLTSLETHRRTLHRPDLQLNYWEWNQGSEPLLLLHGMTDHGLIWANLAEAIGDRYHIIAPDLRGHGDSDKPKQGYDCNVMIEDVNALLNQVGWTSAHIVAHSWSVKVAAIWAARQPEHFRSLVIIDPFFTGKLPGWVKLTFPFLYRVLPFLKTMGPFDRLEQIEQVGRQLKQYRGWSDLQQMAFYAGIEQKSDGRWGSKFVAQARDGIFEDVLRVNGLTQAIAIPTLFLQPEQGLNRTEWQIRPYRTYLKNLRIQSIPGNHWCFLVEPEPSNQAIATFLDQQRHQ